MDESKALAAARPVVVRSVWAHNVEAEFNLIRSCVKRFPILAMDSEFPGVVFRFLEHPNLLSSIQRYYFLKANVDRLHLIQLGLALCDAAGELPTFGTDCAYVWEFNFNDFNIFRDVGNGDCALDSVQLLIDSGIDFQRNITEGIDSRVFGTLIKSSGLIYGASQVSWVTFHGAYDLAYVMKAILGGIPLPESMHRFLAMAKGLFGSGLYDIKHVMKHCNALYGGLEQVAATLGVKRVVGKKHQAGSDSMMTLMTFMRMKELFFIHDDGVQKHAGVMYGLEP